MSSLSERLTAIHAEIAAAAARAGRIADDVELVAVSKTHPPEAIAEAVAEGQHLFGESRVQEARAKIEQCPSRARWHFIGHLQKNKIRHALPLFDLLHSVDSLELARDIDRVAGEMGCFPQVLLEINVAAESSKYGFSQTKLASELEQLLSLERIQIIGLMAIPPLAPQAEMSRRYFVGLRELQGKLESEYGLKLPHLSMGMSSDYPVAVEEGATLVRVGSALFGTRSGKAWKPTVAPGDDF